MVIILYEIKPLFFLSVIWNVIVKAENHVGWGGIMFTEILLRIICHVFKISGILVNDGEYWMENLGKKLNREMGLLFLKYVSRKS